MIPNLHNLFLKTSTLLIFLQLSLLGISQDTEMKPDSLIKLSYKILARNPESSYGLYGLASGYFVKKDYENALKYSKQNIKRTNQYDTICYYIYSASLKNLGREAEALKALQKGLKLYDNYYLLLYENAFLYYKQNNLDEAISLLSACQRKNSYFAECFYLYAACIYESNNSFSCVYPILYGLTLDNQQQRANDAILFLNLFINKKQSKIEIPFRGSRYKLQSTSDIYSQYTKNDNVGMQKLQIDIVNQINFLKDEIKINLKNSNDSTISQNFLQQVSNNNHIDAMLYHCMRSVESEYIQLWFKNNSEALSAYATFLEKTLPGKTE